MSKTIIPSKPDHITWTEDQWKAIWAKDQDILVAAAAGSGKTAVLVTRIIEKILSEDDPINVDELLVVTFTNASAAEMKHRIGEALEKAIVDNPKSQHLRKQLSLINRASISTLHSFCLEVIRKFYYLTDIDPGFRIADSTEAELLRDEVMEELLEEHYGQNNEEFFRLVDAFTSDRNDAALQQIVRSLHNFSQSYPDPESWLHQTNEMYTITDDIEIEDLPFWDSLTFDISMQLQSARDLLEQALELTKLPSGPAPRAENLLDDLTIIDQLEKANSVSWQQMYDSMQTWKFTTAKRCSGDTFDKELIERATKHRNKAKKILETVKGELFSRKPEHYLQDIRELKGYVETLSMLVNQFDVRFKIAKAEKNIVDFSDLEHYCLAILTDKVDGLSRTPSQAAMEYRQQFKEVLVDEYQDVNLVQESILKLVTADGENTGNMFMVGDVKQSIYRFRLAEPNLFLGKYKRFTSDGDKSGLRIDLNRNFRSRKEVLDGTNYLFKQLMGVLVGEIEYDEQAELKKGADYPEDSDYPIELYLIDSATSSEENFQNEESDGEEVEGFEAEELENAQLEARMMAKLIQKAIQEKQQIYDSKTGLYRSATYRDIVVLLRSMPWAPQIMEEFKKQGIPVYANLSSGYFEATEVAIMLSLLKVIDNPQQDIPLVSVLRSPIVGLNEEELAQVRLINSGSYYDAMADFYRKADPDQYPVVYEKISLFYRNLTKWRRMAQQDALSDLIWQLYGETRFYDFVGGMSGGKQRQANLRALYDRARQYESSSFRGLFRFLRFIDRMQERGDDLGAARALGEQEDVVRLMTIHSSKGLEFPLVFIAGLSKQFNMMDLRKSYLLDKEYGFAANYVNPELRITYPSLPQIAFKKKKQLELIAEEMRVLYVAMTRAKEKLYLIGTLKDIEKSVSNWLGNACNSEWLLKDYVRANARSYMDWIGPAIIRHPHSTGFLESVGIDSDFDFNDNVNKHPSHWYIETVPREQLQATEEEIVNETEGWLEQVKNAEKVEIESEFHDKIISQLSWTYSEKDASVNRSKQSVSELKRQLEFRDEQRSTELLRKYKRPISNRPAFMQEKSLTPAEKGTITHLVMQHINVKESISEESVEQLMNELIKKELLTEEQKYAVNIDVIVSFFDSEIGQRLQRASILRREVPFTLAVPASEAYSHWSGEEETVLVQGVIDCMFEDKDGLVLLDYKTDGITDRFHNGFEGAREILADRYRIQLQWYTRAIEGILKKKVNHCYLFFFDGGHLLEV